MIQANHHPFRIAFRELQQEMAQQRARPASLLLSVFSIVFVLSKRGGK